MASQGFRDATPSTYSNQYSTLQQHHLEQLREEILGNREDVSTKNRKLSAETNKRRRELVNRKKARETEEEKRRNEILAERKARIQDVTYRYQRGSTPKSNTPHHYQRARSPRNKRAVSAPVTRANQINLDDALRSIRGNSQLQYNTGDSAAIFLQKYGAHLHPAVPPGGQTEANSTSDATSRHSQSVREHTTTDGSSMFEQQLLQHQATLNKTKVDAAQVFNERLIQDMRLDNGHSLNPGLQNLGLQNSGQQNLGLQNPGVQRGGRERPDDVHSVDSVDSLDSEQPSYRSHIISSGQRQPPTTKNTNNNSPATSEQSPGGGTYRQESPTVLVNDDRAKVISSLIKSQGASMQRQSATTTATPTMEANTLLGFQVVNTNDYSRLSRQSTKVDSKSSSSSKTQVVEPFMTHSRVGDRQVIVDRTIDNNETDTNDPDSFYLKSRTESQPLVAEFPTHAWGVADSSSVSEPEPQNLQPPASHPFLPADHRAFAYTDSFSDTASDSGAPRSILKKRGVSSASLPRSHSTPSIRDSLEITKQNFKSSNCHVESPKSAKKSVRFSERRSEPVLFQKGSSPSSIPRPVSSKPSHNNVPHISRAITPNVSDKSINGKQPNTPPKGPVVANHNIQLTNNGKAEMAESEQDKPKSLADIRLDRTPTDDEIDILWDKVRDCLQETPTGSVRSAPGNLQQQNQQPINSINGSGSVNHNQSNGLPPKPPIKKITASNINQIGRAQSAGHRRSSSDSGQTPLQRPKQNPRSFNHHQEVAHNQPADGLIHHHQGHVAMNGQATLNGQITSPKGPTQSTLEPSLSAMVNNTPQDVSESMMSYLTAEQLASNESLNDRDILKAMADSNYRQQLGGNGRPIVPMSALSMEEQRILQSLDRLNNKLKVVEDGPFSNRSQQNDYQSPTGAPTSAMMYNSNGFVSLNALTNHNGFTSSLTSSKVQLKPHPPYTGSTGQRSFSATPRGFRGHRPIQTRQRTGSADTIRHNGMSANVAGTNRQFRLY